MTGQRNLITFLAGILTLLLAAFLNAQEISATATSIRGMVTVTSDNGETRDISRGDQIYSGDLIETSSRSRIRMAFTDGGTYVLKENTSFEIDDYVFSEQQGGTGKATFQLLKGTVEALSGLIGKDNRENFRLETPLAAIGLRGTEFTVNVIQPENPGDPVRVQLSVIGGIVTYQSTITIPGAPPPQLLDVYQGNSIEQMENTLPQEISSIIVPLLTITVDGEEVEEVIEEEYEPETNDNNEDPSEETSPESDNQSENDGISDQDSSPGNSEGTAAENNASEQALVAQGNRNEAAQENASNPDTPPGQGGDTPPGQNANTPPGQGGDTPPGQNTNTPPGQGGDTPPGQNANTPPGQGGDTPPGQNANTPPGQGGDTPPGQNANTPPGQGGDTPPGQNTNNPPGQNGNTPPGAGGNNPGRGNGGGSPIVSSSSTTTSGDLQ